MLQLDFSDSLQDLMKHISEQLKYSIDHNQANNLISQITSSQSTEIVFLSQY